MMNILLEHTWHRLCHHVTECDVIRAQREEEVGTLTGKVNVNFDASPYRLHLCNTCNLLQIIKTPWQSELFITAGCRGGFTASTVTGGVVAVWCGDGCRVAVEERVASHREI